MKITICGRLVYKDLMEDMERILTYCGHTVFLPVGSESKHEPTEAEITALHRAHNEKIKLADKVWIISPYGDDTFREVRVSERLGKEMRFIPVTDAPKINDAYEKDGPDGVEKWIAKYTVE